jgi:TPP-dependent trihydroxycyclohexane-1,2-dione (THcHDO) dehydratase
MTLIRYAELLMSEIATASFVIERPGETARPITVHIGQPVQRGAHEWECSYRIEGMAVLQRPSAAIGVDGLQALALALRSAMGALEHVVRTGGSVKYETGDETSVSLSSYLESGFPGSPSA